MHPRLSILRRWRALRVVAAAWLTVPLAPPAAADPPGRAAKPAEAGITIDVAPGNWGKADPQTIQLVLQSVAAEFQSLVAAPREGLKIRVVPRGVSPRVLYERGAEGEYVILLTARDDRWSQYAYQFSHELCHVLSNFDHKERNGEEVATGNQWFEESLCETAALFTLKRLAVAWTQQPPTRNWIGYGPVFASYAERLLAETHRHLPPTQSLGEWYAENQASLRESPYLREKNEVVATHLLALFEQDPGMWHAISYLNADRSSAAKGFANYLADWQAACPPGDKEFVQQTAALFGLGPTLAAIGSPLASLGDNATALSFRAGRPH
jgi:hypothetical protein